MSRASNRARLVSRYRYDVLVRMRDAGMSLARIAPYFFISRQRVAQILKRGPVAAQLEIPLSRPSERLAFVADKDLPESS